MKIKSIITVLFAMLIYTGLAIPVPLSGPPRSSVLIDSSANQYSMAGTAHECLGYHPVIGGLGFVCRGFITSGMLNVFETDSLFGFFIDDFNVYQQDFGPARHPSFNATDLPIISFPYIFSQFGGIAGICQSGGWWSGYWDAPVDLGPGQIYGSMITGKQLASGNILFIGLTTQSQIIYRTTSFVLQPLASGILASDCTYGGFDINSDHVYVFYYDSSMNVYHKTTVDGVSWGPQEPDSIIWPQPYPNTRIRYMQMALTNAGNPILVFNVIDGDDLEWPYYGKIYVNVAPAETCIEISSTFGMPDTECIYTTIATGSTNNDKVAVIYCTPRNDLPDSLCFWDIFYNYSTDNGITWGTPMNITSADSINHCLPQLAKRLSSFAFYYAYGTAIANSNIDLLHLYNLNEARATRWYLNYSAFTSITERGAEKPQGMILTVAPNPFTRILTVRFQIPSAKFQTNTKSQVTLRVYDASGRSVKSFNHLTIQPFNQIVWSGDDQCDRRVPAGVYLIVLESGSKRITQKVVLLE